MAHAMPSSVHWGVLTSILILGPKLPGWRFYSERRVLRDLAILTLLHGICRILTRTEDRDHQAAHTLRMGRTYAILTYAFWELSPAVLSEGWRCLPPPVICSDHTKWQLFERSGPAQADPRPYVYASMGHASPTSHPSFGAKAPQLRQLG